jgi:hypothetical protein
MYLPIYGNGYTNATIVLHSANDAEALALPVEKAVGRLGAAKLAVNPTGASPVRGNRPVATVAISSVRNG